MTDGIVTKPFTAHLVLESVERRLEAGERIAAEELAHWGNSVNHLIHTGRLALVNEVVIDDASVESLVNALVERADQLGEKAIEKLQQLVPAVEQDEEERFAEISERADEFLAELAAHGINLLENVKVEDLLSELERRGLAPQAVEPAEGDGATGAGDDLGGDADGAPASEPSADTLPSDDAPAEPAAAQVDEPSAAEVEPVVEDENGQAEASAADQPEPAQSTATEPAASPDDSAAPQS